MSRAVGLILALVAGGCYDVSGLSRAFVSSGGRDGGLSGDGSGTPDDGGAWHKLASPTTAALRGVFGSDGGDVFAVGASSVIVRLAVAAPPALETAPPGYNLRAVWSGGGATFAVGDSGVVLARGASWSGAGVVDATFYAVTALPAGEPLVAGSGGTIMQRAGSLWSGEDAAVLVALRGAWTRAGGDVLLAGDGGTILHGTAGVWTAATSPTSSDLHAIWGTSTEAWIVGAGGVVLHAGSGEVWAAETSGTTAELNGVSGSGAVVWAVGAGGTILARRNGAWSVERSGGADLRAVWAGSNAVVAVGDGGTIFARAP